ncbi:MAG: exodeoxyribonuclease VII small subunit [Eubacteriales bacterium]|nr:exodeoxyribonuclease VII small subunit [Eubacteriales bacterium]MDD4474862.1 exodeoxyribonuclease VII small subunit [Eubacteriales bacterium]
MSKTTNHTFETAMKRLEEIVVALDDGSAPLDELIKLFEEGTGLVKLCNTMLDKAESKVKILSEKNGVVTEEDFTTTEE